MIIIDKKNVGQWKEMYGSPDMLVGYGADTKFSAASNQTILLVNDESLIILYISKLRNRLVEKQVYSKAELQESVIKTTTLHEIWSFKVGLRKYCFRIQRKILPLGDMQRDFLEFIKKHDFV